MEAQQGPGHEVHIGREAQTPGCPSVSEVQIDHKEPPYPQVTWTGSDRAGPPELGTFSTGRDTQNRAKLETLEMLFIFIF